MRAWLIRALVSLGLTTQGHADLIKYQIAATASGTLGSTSLTDALVTVALFGDSSTIVAGTGVFSSFRGNIVRFSAGRTLRWGRNIAATR